MKAYASALVLAAALFSVTASGQEMTQLSCKDFIPTDEARERFPDLAGACEGIVERDGELFGLFRAEVRRVHGSRVTLHLPATDHTFTVKPDPSLRVLIDGRKVRPRDLRPKDEIRVYLSASEFAKPDVEEIAFVTESDFVVDVPIDEISSVSLPGRVVTSTARREAIVESVNKETREIKVVDANGKIHMFVAGDLVANFDQIEPRDRIVTEYLESIAVFVAPAGTPALGDMGLVEVAPLGEKPGVGIADTFMVAATIDAIDTAERLVTLRGEDGFQTVIKVADDVDLAEFKAGDEVRMRVTQAVAISVVEAP
jgi:Cu/Ag efflux protein CusF